MDDLCFEKLYYETLTAWLNIPDMVQYREHEEIITRNWKQNSNEILYNTKLIASDLQIDPAFKMELNVKRKVVFWRSWSDGNRLIPYFSL